MDKIILFILQLKHFKIREYMWTWIFIPRYYGVIKKFSELFKWIDVW